MQVTSGRQSKLQKYSRFKYVYFDKLEYNSIIKHIVIKSF